MSVKVPPTSIPIRRMRASRPGLGRLLVDAINLRDVSLAQGGIMLLATTFVLVNLAVDVLYVYLDPRIRYD